MAKPDERVSPDGFLHLDDCEVWTEPRRCSCGARSRGGGNVLMRSALDARDMQDLQHRRLDPGDLPSFGVSA